MFCFGLQSIARLINTNASYFNKHRLESEGNFPETFKSQLEKNKNVIYRAGSVRVGKNCALGLSTAEAVGLGRYSDRGHSFSQYGPTQAGE